ATKAEALLMLMAPEYHECDISYSLLFDPDPIEKTGEFQESIVRPGVLGTPGGRLPLKGVTKPVNRTRHNVHGVREVTAQLLRDAGGGVRYSVADMTGGIGYGFGRVKPCFLSGSLKHCLPPSPIRCSSRRRATECRGWDRRNPTLPPRGRGWPGRASRRGGFPR